MGATTDVVVEGRRLRLSSLDKVLYPSTGTTKADAIAYYAEVADVLLPHVRGRPVTRKRWVDGTAGEAFFAKQLEPGAPEWVARKGLRHSSRVTEYPLATEAATLVWFAQVAALELHVPQWRFGSDGAPAPPDRLVIDLDPGPGAGLAECVEVAHWARELLDGMGLESIPVTSGSKGIHLYAGLDGGATSEQVSAVAKELARALAADHPRLVVSEQRKSLREGKVLVDWSQNSAAKTTIAPYSMRGRARPWVAAPRTWEEIDDPGLAHLEIDEVLEALHRRGDPLAALAGPGTDRLATYRSMRDASRTSEPVPEAAPVPRPGGRSFVIQEHDARRKHFDFRLERDGVLVSWALPKGEPTDPKRNHLAVRTEDHPLEYGTFEGEIPMGEYGAGHVQIWDSGVYELEKWRDDEVIVTLEGRRGRRRIALIRTGGDQWLAHLMAPRSRPQPTSDGGRAAESPDLPPAAPGEAIAPMLASSGARSDVVHSAEEWLVEMKWDGIRAIATVRDGRLRVASRSGRDITGEYPELADLADRVPGDAVLDGEIVALDNRGRPDFGLLQQRMNLTDPREVAAAARAVPVRLLLFDLLAADGRSWLGEPC
ncbi:MAG: non-homologous end-joining DNA ligase, partial [Actinomycetota bacterium]|nr:non-homologous end-joining DNA ligase [Actinomycetota bacterium]